MENRPFIHEDFLLDSAVARELYHRHAKPQPIIDFHCHLDPDKIANDHRFGTLTELWLASDHYKWRAMRANGVPERLITGAASAWEKFEAWAATVPQTLRNPLYHWTHLELAFPLGIRDLLGPATARAIYESANDRLREPAFSARGLLTQYRVVLVATTDDPADTLAPHLARRAATDEAPRLVPTWRPDRAFAVASPEQFASWLTRLEHTVGAAIPTYDRLLEALEERHTAFHLAGCRASDHGLETLLAGEFSLAVAREAFEVARRGVPVVGDLAAAYHSALLLELSRMDHRRGWVQQYHLGAARDLNRQGRMTLGPDAGFDAIGDAQIAPGLVAHLDRLATRDELAKTIVYNANPRDTEQLATIIGCFQGGVPGKIQLGSAWWFLDQLDGMQKHLEAVSNHGLLGRFVGMLTDSRSFLSYSRHDYFRRLLCNLLGDDVVRGRLPDDRGLLGQLVAALCYGNARDYFGFELTG